MSSTPLHRRKRPLLSAPILLAIGTPQAAEISTDPCDYVPLPEGTNLGLLYLQHAT